MSVMHNPEQDANGSIEVISHFLQVQHWINILDTHIVWNCQVDRRVVQDAHDATGNQHVGHLLGMLSRNGNHGVEDMVFTGKSRNIPGVLHCEGADLGPNLVWSVVEQRDDAEAAL